MRRTIFGLCLSLGFTAAALAAAEPAAPAPKAQAATPAMWTVHGSKGTVYMLGSIHALPKNVHWQTPQLMARMAEADIFVFEVPMDAGSRAYAASYFRENALMPAGMSLPSMFDAEMRSDFRDVVMLTHADPTYIVY